MRKNWLGFPRELIKLLNIPVTCRDERGSYTGNLHNTC